eukprot:tig00000551_g2036.t1
MADFSGVAPHGRSAYRAKLSKSPVGLPIQVIARVRPVLRTEPAPAGNIQVTGRKLMLVPPGRREGSASDEFVLDAVYGPEASTKELFDQSVMPIIQGVLDGVSGCIIAFGQTGSGKTFTMDGVRGAAGQGVVPLAVGALMQLLRDKQNNVAATASAGQVGLRRGRGPEFNYRVRFQYAEVYDERVQDLLQPQNRDLPLEDDPELGTVCGALVAAPVHDAEDLLELYNQGRIARTSAATDFGPAAERATGIAFVDVVQTYDPGQAGQAPQVLVSRLTFVDCPGSEKLASDAANTRLREGPTLNRAVFALSSLLRTLGGQKEVEYVSYRDSKVTAMLQEQIGGNAVTLLIAALKPGSYEASSVTMQVAAAAGRVQNYPVINDDRVHGLLTKRRLDIMQARMELEAVKLEAAGGRGLPEEQEMRAARMKAHEAEGELLAARHDVVRLQEDKERLNGKLGELRSKLEQLVTEKAAVQGELIASEEERLTVSRALVDLQIENNTLAEKAEAEKYEVVNKLLSTENELLEAEMRLQERDKKIEELTRQLAETNGQREELRVDYVALKGRSDELARLLEAERKKVEEMSLEIVNLVNARDALLKEREEMRGERGRLMRLVEDKDAAGTSVAAASRSLEEQAAALKSANEELKAEAMRAKLELEKAVVQGEAAKAALERALTDLQRKYEEELSGVKRQLAEAVAGLSRERVQGKQLARRVGDLEGDQAERTRREVVLHADREAAIRKAEEDNRKYRETLQTYLRRIADLSRVLARGQGPLERAQEAEARMQMQAATQELTQELVESYSEKEGRVVAEAAALRKQARELLLRNRVLLQAYRTARNALADATPPGQPLPEVLSEEQLRGQLGEQVSDREAELERECESLRHRLGELESELVQQSDMALRTVDAYQRLLSDLLPEGTTAVLGPLAGARKLQRVSEEVKASIRQKRERREAMRAGLGENPARTPPEVAATRHTASAIQGRELEAARRELEACRREIVDLRAQVKLLGSDGGGTAAKLAAQVVQLQQRLREWTANAQAELEKERAELRTRCLVAEEQLRELQAYLADATTRYQREIASRPAAPVQAPPAQQPPVPAPPRQSHSAGERGREALPENGNPVAAWRRPPGS